VSTPASSKVGESEGLEALRELAFDLRSSWNHRADTLWQRIDPELWRETGNPWLVFQSAYPARLREILAEASFRDTAQALASLRRERLAAPSWFSGKYGDAHIGTVAFFSMEYALSEGLPIYAGGLGNVAGDYLKTASDLGVPLVGVGLLYQQGYFRQVIDANAAQREFYPFNDVAQLPVTPVRDAEGVRVRVRLPRAGPPVWLRAWQANVGRVRLYLLDSNDSANAPADRGITAQLYGGGVETRLLQEMALGICGWRLLRSIGISPTVCHLNEGHATFAALERAREFMEMAKCSFDVALAATRAGNVFTTHTPVEAGFDKFPRPLLDAYLGAYVRDELGIPMDRLLAMGRAGSADGHEPLNMAWLATRLSGAVNAVSLLHEQVSRSLFAPLFPRWPTADVPVGHVTNGIHVPSWDSAEADSLWTQACGPARWEGTTEPLKEKIAACSDATLWGMRAGARAELVAFVRERLVDQLAASGFTGAQLEAAARVFDPDTLTLGFARRFTEYKRPALLLHDCERLARLLSNRRSPVQIVIAGKAHPQDVVGKTFVEQWTRFVRRDDVRASAVFLADYDLRMAEHLVRGVDVWINTPRPPLEACGTSGMKVLVNGGVHLSTRDGWWAEAYRPEVGFAIDGHDEAESVYRLLENDVVPSFYERDNHGIPREWVRRIRTSMAELTPMYSADRALREYVERFYVVAAKAFADRAANGGKLAEQIAESTRVAASHWSLLRFGELRVRTEGAQHSFETSVYVDDLDPDCVKVELYADATDGFEAARIPMARAASLVGGKGFVYAASVSDSRPADHFTPRALFGGRDVAVPLEAPMIAWAR
jgi:starch phosphorylase